MNDSAHDTKHVVVVLAYKESPYLESCLRDLVAQGLTAADLLCTTSTPSPFIEDICRRHGVPLVVNPVRRSIGSDWNFALRQAADVQWITLAHQDDIYLPDYVAQIRAAIAANPDAAMIVPWFREYADGRRRPMNLTHAVKYLLFLYAFRGRRTLSTAAQKLRLLSFGNPVPCGGVALNRSRYALGFDENLQFTLDWKQWLELARADGDFVLIHKPLLYRRIHKSSATSACTQNGLRAEEEMAIFRQLWPQWLAQRLIKLYKLSYLSNQTQT